VWLCLLTSMVVFVFGSSKTAYAANPTTINFQGKVVDSSSLNPTNTTYPFVFRIYNTASPTTATACGSDSSCLYEESIASLSVTNGVFQVELGGTCSGGLVAANTCTKSAAIDFSTSNSLYLTMKFNNDAAGFMSPTIHLTTVPYAFNADRLGGIAASGFIQNTTSPQSSSNFNISGAGVVGTSLQAPVISTAASTDLALQPTTGLVALNRASTANELRVYENAASPSNYASITATSNTATFKSNTGTTLVGNGSGAITLSAGAGAAVNITGNAASLWQTSAGNITVQAGSGTVTLGTSTILTSTAGLTVQGGSTLSLLSTSSSNISLDSGTTGSILIGGDTASAKTISIGPTGTNTSSTILNLGVNTAGTQDINIGSTGSGNAAAGTTVSIQGGTTANTAVVINTNGAGGITIDSGTTGNINIGNSANAKAVAIGNSTSGTTVTQTAGAVTNTLSNTGNTVKTNSNSTTGFTVQNSGGISLVNVDTSTNNSNNIATNPSFETATMWTAKNGSGASATSQASSPFYDGVKSMQVATSSTATNAGALFSTSLTLNATYVLSLYVKASTTNFSTFQMGYTNTGGDNNCFTSDQTVVLSGWTRMTCSFTVTTTAGTSIYVKQTDALGRTYFIDAVLLETDANASGYYENGQISLQGTVNTPLVLQNTSNSANAFLVQNSAGSNIFGVDTTDTNLVDNPGVEVNTVRWAGKSTGTAPVISRDTSNTYLGYAGLKAVTGTTAQDGVKYTFANNTTLLASTQYTLSFYAKISASSIATFSFGRSDTGVTAGETSCITTGSLTTTWTRFSCSFNTGATMGASGNPYIYMSQGTGTSSITFFVDAVSLEPGATATPYGAGSIYLNGIINSPVNFQNKTDSTTAFQVQNSASLMLLAIDSANKNIQVGSSTTDANAVFLTLDSYNTAADPTAPANGAMYYNTSTNVFRCRQNSVWRNCIESPSNSSTADQTPTAATLTYLTGSSITIPQGGVRAGTQFVWRMSLSKSAAGTAAPTFAVVFGTTATTTDTARASFTLPVETAVVDTAQINLICTVRSVSATATISCNLQMTHTAVDCAGFVSAASCVAPVASEFVATVTSGTFDDTVANSIIGVTVNSGTANVFTFQQIQAQSINL
jgi:hypothetical protein